MVVCACRSVAMSAMPAKAGGGSGTTWSWNYK